MVTYDKKERLTLTQEKKKKLEVTPNKVSMRQNRTEL